MADKWADYLVSAVRYNATETHIEHVQIRFNEGEDVSGPSTWNRAKVVERLEEGRRFITIFRHDDSWVKGADVTIFTVDDEEFIRTDSDEIEEDNLENLPRF